MKVDKAFGPLLSNYEVLTLLKEQEAYRKAQGKMESSHVANLSTIQFECLKYLNDSPCSVQSAEAVSSLLTQIKGFALTKAEKLQILNLRPRSAVELHILIEECEERFEPERLDELLEIIAASLPHFGPEEEEEEGQDEEMDEAE
ncbi:hypothetical protein IWQ60_012093 [Tieghemiomyces parasiticus]|uniref:DNA-directed RNA polymerase III subunit RPC9 n=1 Tax=Tieghemiomyces parasiticus TaxID=78921 RepID=A0A9W7ZQR9_9FUNG|nr:hypothetical protein IWQ60_012093 [Tieghemiomyces parasiticus]